MSKFSTPELRRVNIATGMNSEVWSKKEANHIEDNTLEYK
jgi:hypothetical protein